MTGRTRAAADAAAGRPSAIVVGAGIIGSTTAYALAKSGVQTTLVDADEPGMGCSFGNAGAISPGSVAPLAMPGILRGAAAMLGDPEGPLYIRPSYLLRASPWLVRFVAGARPARVQAIAEALYQLHHGAVEAHQALAREIGVAELVQRRGQLQLYPDEAALAKDAAAWALRQRFGVEVQRLDRDGILALEPAVGPRYKIGMYLRDHAMIVNPHRYVRSLVAAFAARGGRLARDRVERIEPAGRGWRCVGSQRALAADHVVVAAGIASSALLKPLGMRPALQSQRGYHVTFHGPAAPISRVVVLADRKAFMTPMEDGLRIAGTVEIASLGAAPNPRRAAVLERFARETFGGLDGATTSMWTGHRPCTPETLPCIGPAPGRQGLWLAFGHGHTGMTDAPATASRIAAGITGHAMTAGSSNRWPCADQSGETPCFRTALEATR